MDIIALWINVCVVDWTAEMSAIASNAVSLASHPLDPASAYVHRQTCRQQQTRE